MSVGNDDFAVRYYYESSNQYPTELNSNLNAADNEDVQFVLFKPTSFLQRHLSTASTDTQSSSNILMAPMQPEESSPLRETHTDPFSVPKCIRHFDGLRMIITTMIVFSISITIALIVQIYVGPPQIVSHGGLVSSSQYCSNAGFNLWKTHEASTVDAAVFTALCICISHPHSAGIGGGGFAIVHNQKLVEDATKFYNFRESSPIMFSDITFNSIHFEKKTPDEISKILTPGVPGVLKGLEKMHSEYGGRLTWKFIIDEIASLAKLGVPVSQDFAEAINQTDLSTLSPELHSLLTKSNNTKLEQDDSITQPDLAKILQAVANEGSNALYSGSLTSNFVSTITSKGGILTENDMKNYKVDVTYQVNQTRFADSKIITGGPPSSGFALHGTMQTMALYGNSDRCLQIHRIVEALKFNLGLQIQLGDPSRPNFTFPEFYLNKALGISIQQQINDSSSYSPEHYLNNFQPLELRSTDPQFVSIIGPDGFAVVILLSIGSMFGSGVMSSGILLNDAMLDFSWTGRNSHNFSNLNISEANSLYGGVKPASPLVPAIAIPSTTKCGNYALLTSSPSQFFLFNAAQVFFYSQNMNIPAAIDHTRVYQSLISNNLQVENGTSTSDLITCLKNKNHNVTLVAKDSMGTVDAVHWFDNQVQVFTGNQPDNLNKTAFVF